MVYSVRPTPTNAATLKNSALVTLTFRTNPDDWRMNSFGVVLAAAADGVGEALASDTSPPECTRRRKPKGRASVPPPQLAIKPGARSMSADTGRPTTLR